MKKIASAAMIFFMVLTAFIVPNNTVYANTVAVSVNATSVDIGDTVTVTVKVPTGITAQIDVAYPSNLLSFSNCSTTANNNGSSVTMNLGSFSSPTATISFAAKASGTATFAVTPITAGSEETAEEVELGSASATVTIANQVTTAPETPEKPETPEDPNTPETPEKPETPETPTTPVLSGDNKLGYLKLSSGTLSPAFHPDTTKYNVKVSYDVTKVTVSAVPSSASAVVTSVTGGKDLQVGENTINITVKAENGVSKTYTIVVTRKEKEVVQEEETTTEAIEVPAETFDWNGTVLAFKDDIPEEVIPVDFEKITKRIRNTEVPVLDLKDGLLTVVYLADESGNNSLYIYDEKLNDIYPFVLLSTEEQYVIVLRPDDASAPTGHVPCTLSIEGKGLVNAYQINTEEFLKEGNAALFGAETVFAAEAKPTDFYLLYCLNKDGEYGWYQYDAIEGTFQRYCTALFNTAVDAKEDEDINNMMDELAQTKQMLMIVAIVAGAVVIILLIIIVVFSRKLKEYDEYEFYDDDGTDDDIEYIEAEVEEHEIEVEDGEIEIEFYEMPASSVSESEVVEDDDSEVEIEFYEMSSEPEIPDMEALLVKEAMKEQPASQPERTMEQPKRVVTPIDVDDDDSDLEFIDLD